MKFGFVVGTRPNFIKAIPVYNQFKKKFESHLIHTSQHYNKELSDFILKDLEASEPDFKFTDETFSSLSFEKQLGSIMDYLSQIYKKEKYDWIFVFGDVSSTLAASLVAKYQHIKVAHIESGLRSFDRDMPEEINRILTDSISDLCFVTEKSGIENLLKEGKSKKQIHLVGNTMIDSLMQFKNKILKAPKKFEPFSYYACTLHRPSNVDDKDTFQEKLEQLVDACGDKKIVFPVHPRTKKNFDQFPSSLKEKFTVTPPLGYIDFLGLVYNSAAVLTDSGGIQEEASILNVPCFTLRENTERPITISKGTNKLTNFKDLKKHLHKIPRPKKSRALNQKIPLWDGKASKRILDEFI